MKQTFDVTGINMRLTLQPLAMYPSDPTTHRTANQFARATLTPDGPATVLVNWKDNLASVELWGDGSSWVGDRLEALLGLNDDVSTFLPAVAASGATDLAKRTALDDTAPPHIDIVRKMWRQRSGLRMCASHTLWHDVAFLILGQRVTSANAANQWAGLCRKFGEPGPGPLKLLLPPAAEVIAKTPYTDFHGLGIERQRADNLRAAAKFVPKFERLTDLPSADLRAKLELIRGIGPWTATNVLAMTVGDPDAVILGDYGLPSGISWNLAGERKGTDERMLELLEPFRPHRGRVARLAMVAGTHPPRRGPKIRNPRIQTM